MQLAERMSPVYTIIDKVLGGLTLRQALQGMELSPQSFGRLLADDKEAAAAYARAAELKADLIADEVVSLADGDGDPAKVRNQMTARQWLAAKLYAKRYGERIDLNVTQTIDVGGTLAEARARLLRPVRDQLTDDSAQVLDVQAKQVHAVDIAAVAVGTDEQDARPLIPDIFS